MIPRPTDTGAFETTQPRSRREEVRKAAVARTPRWYNPWVHLAFPSAFGLAMIAASFASLDRPSPLVFLTIPAVLLLVNFIEWHIHRNILHRRSWPLEELFWRHTPEHHVIFVCDDMAMRSRVEFRLVLIPFYGIVAIFLTTLPVAAGIWALASPNVALLWVASNMAYVVAYEWLHLAYHLPETSLIGRSRAIRWLRRHHAKHHTPELMQKWNFNVTVPVADWALRTTHPDTRA